MHRTRVKICAVTRSEDALAAVAAGADAIGMVLHAPSQRLISTDHARSIVAALPPFVTAIGLFADAPAAEMIETARTLGLVALQLHGNETPEMAAALAPLRVIKVIHVQTATFSDEIHRWSPAIRSGQLSNLAGLLLDAPGGGGKGVANDWELLERHRAELDALPAWIAAGGLTPVNVGQIIRRLRPWAVDVSSGVESAPRQKSPQLLQAFVQAVRQADLQA
jgi:phosphoribosylanthranilate isomerase